MRFFRRGFIGLYGSSPRVANAKYTIFGSDIGTSNTVIDQIGIDGREVMSTSCLYSTTTVTLTFGTSFANKYVSYLNCDTGSYVNSVSQISGSYTWYLPTSTKIKDIKIYSDSNRTVLFAWYKVVEGYGTILNDCLSSTYDGTTDATLSSGSIWSNTYNPLVTNYLNTEGYCRKMSKNMPKLKGLNEFKLDNAGWCLQNLGETTHKGPYVTTGNIEILSTEKFIFAFDVIWDGNTDGGTFGIARTSTPENGIGGIIISSTGIHWFHSNSGGGTIVTTYYYAILPNVFYHIELTKEKDDTSAIGKAFVNGIEITNFVDVGVKTWTSINVPIVFCRGYSSSSILHGKLLNIYLKRGATTTGHLNTQLLLSDQTIGSPTYFYPCQEGYYDANANKVLDVVGNNHATITMVGTPAKDIRDIAGKQTVSNYNTTYGLTSTIVDAYGNEKYIPKKLDGTNLSYDLPTGFSVGTFRKTGTAKHNLQITGKCLQNLNETTYKGFVASMPMNLTECDFIVAFNFIWDGNVDTGNCGIYSNNDFTYTNFGMLYTNNVGNLIWRHYSSSSDNIITSQTVISPNVNHFIILVKNSNTTPKSKIFVSGVEKSLIVNNNGDLFSYGNKIMEIGRGQANNYVLHGKIWNFYIKINDTISTGYNNITELLSAKTPTYFYPCQESYYENATNLKTVYDVVGGNHATITLVNKTMSQIIGRQEYDNYNLKYGYTNFSNGTNTQNIPYSLNKTKTITTPTISGYSAIERPYSATKHNLADGRILGARSSQFVGLGSEMIPSSDFKNWSGSAPNQVPDLFTLGGTQNASNYFEPISAGKGLHIVSDGTFSSINLSAGLKIGSSYLVKMNITSITGTVEIDIGPGGGILAYNSSGYKTAIVVCSVNSSITIKRASAANVNISFISVREILSTYSYLPSGEYQDMFWCKDACVGNWLGYPEIWKSTLRDTIYYDSANPFRWCPCEMNHAYMLRYINNAYLGTFLLQYSADGYIGETSLFYPALSESERSSYGFANGLGSNVYGDNLVNPTTLNLNSRYIVTSGSIVYNTVTYNITDQFVTDGVTNSCSGTGNCQQILI